MRSWQINELGDPWDILELTEVDAPEPAPGQVAIDIGAVGVAFPNVLQAQGKYQVKLEPPFSPATEIAGTVSAIGEGVEGFAVGDRVMTMDGATISECAVADARRVFPIPGDLSAAQATAFLAKASDAVVIAVAGGPEKVALCKELGADIAIDYRATPDFVDEVREASGGGVDVCYEVVGGDTFQHARRCMGWDGRLLIIGFAGGTIPDSPMNHALLKNYSIVGVHWGASIARDPSSLTRQQQELGALAEAGKISPHMHPPYPFGEARQAFHDIAHRGTTGKVVLEL